MSKLLFTIAIFLIISSCKKDNTGENFKQVAISGNVFDSSAKAGMPNVTVRMSWYGPGSQETFLDSVKTDAQGNYIFKERIDISRFSNQTLEIAAVVPAGFISIFDMEHPTVGASIFGFGNSDSWQLQPFAMYQKTNITINLQRNSTDSFTEFILSYNYGGRNYWVNISNTTPTTSQTYQINSAVGVQTNIHWVKKQLDGSSTTYRDSIIPLANYVNSINIPY